MNLQSLKKAEANFLLQFPEGFASPKIQAMAKKHRFAKMVDQSHELFTRSNFARPQTIADNLTKIVSGASMVSMFEKPKFRSFTTALDNLEKEMLCHALEQRLFGDEQQGFEMMLDLLQTRKLAKWTLMTIVPVYFKSDYEVFVKPTTAKGIIKLLELDDLQYKPMPSWAFYIRFREYINELKQQVDPSLSPNNAAFTGFLMMSLQP